MSWQISIASLNGGAFNSFSALACSQPRRHLASADVSTFTFTEAAAAFDAMPLGQLDDPCIVQWVPDKACDPPAQVIFQGKLTKLPRTGNTTREERQYIISDPWKDLERLTYQQQWAIPGAAEWRSEVILGSDNGAIIGNDLAIEQVLAFAIARNAQLQAGTILHNLAGSTAAPTPYKQMKDITCAQAIKELLRLTPDAVTWFDYTQSPPALNITRRGDCAPVNFTGTAGVNGVEIELTPRNDLVRSQVMLRYIQENQVDNAPVVTSTPDGAGQPTPGTDMVDGLAFDAFVASVRIAGSNSSYQKQPVTTLAPFPTLNSAGEADGGGPADDPAIQWWQRVIPWLRDLGSPSTFTPASVADQLVITNIYGTYQSGQGQDDGTGMIAVDYTLYPNELINGTLAAWMGVRWATCNITALVKYSFPSDPSAYSDQDNQAAAIFGGDDGSGNSPAIGIYATPTLTDAVTQTYEQLSSYTAGEPLPVGLAAILYAALSVLHYEGHYSSVSRESIPGNTLGTVLNITGSQNNAWANMNALVQTIEEDFETGVIQWKVGPPGHLGVQDLLEMLRYTRTRPPSSHAAEKESGTPSAVSVDGGVATRTTTGIIVAPPPTVFPWIGAVIDNPATPDTPTPTWDGVIGYGQSSFAIAMSDSARPDPLYKFELDVGNTDDEASGSTEDSSSLNHSLSIITGDDDYTNDCFWLGATDGSGGGGSLYLCPSDPSIHFSPNLDPTGDDGSDQSIFISLPDLKLDIGDGAGNSATLTASDDDNDDSPSLYLEDADGQSCLLATDGPGFNDWPVLDLGSGEGDNATLCLSDPDNDDLPSLNLGDSDGNSITVTSQEIDIEGSDGASNIIDDNSMTITLDDDDAVIDMTGSGGANVYISTGDIDGGDASFQDWSQDDGGSFYVLSTGDGSDFSDAVDAIIGDYDWADDDNFADAVNSLIEDYLNDCTISGTCSGSSVSITLTHS